MKKLLVFIVLFVIALCTFSFAEDQLDAALKSGKPAIVKLGADWCPPCKAMKPVLKDLSKDLKGKVVVLDLDIEKYQKLSAEYKVTLIPTTLFYDKNGKYVDKVVGGMSKKEIMSKLKGLKLIK